MLMIFSLRHNFIKSSDSSVPDTNSYTAAIETIKILRSQYKATLPDSPKKKRTADVLVLSSPLDTQKSAGKKRARHF